MNARRRVGSNYFDINMPETYQEAFQLVSSCSLFETHVSTGTFELLSYLFGFQSASVANQKEHLVIILANAFSRQEKPDKIHRKVFANYIRWCRFHRISPIFPGQELGQITQLALFFLIWGEAANLRFMPECLCFLYHKAATRLDLILMKQLDSIAIQKEYQPESNYLYMVITPIYAQIAQMKTSRQDHDQTRNYDDINEFFWSKMCLQFNETTVASALSLQHVKTFREKRSLFNPLLAFYRIYFFLLVMLHILIAIAYVAYRGEPSEKDGFGFYENFFSQDTDDLRRHSFFSTQVTFSFLSIVKVVLEVWIDGLRIYSTGRYASALFARFLWHALFFALSVVVMLSPKEDAIGSQTYLDIAPLIFAVYFFPIIISSIAKSFFSRQVHRSMWGTFIRESSFDYTGRNMQPPFHMYCKYALFWIVVFGCKFLFNLQLMIVPLIGPSVEIWQLERSVLDNPLQGIFESNHNLFLLILLWLPVVLVYLYDSQIWFTILQAVVGMVRGFRLKVGQSSRVTRFISRLKEAPYHFDQSIVSHLARAMSLPSGNNTSKQQMMELQSRLRFAVVWNECISSFRLSDLIDDREAMILQYTIEDDGSVGDPVFLFAGIASNAVDVAAAKASNPKGLLKDLKKKGFLPCVSTTLALTRQVFSQLLGDQDRSVLEAMDYLTSRVGTLNRHVSMDRFPEIRDALIDFLMAVLDLPDPTETEAFHDHESVLLVTQQAQLLCRTFEQASKDDFVVELFRSCMFASMTSELTYQKERLQAFFKNPKSMNITTRLFLLLTLDVADALPRCNEAQRRISFFLHSLSMDMPSIASMESIQSFSVITPYYNETVLFGLEELNAPVKGNPLFNTVEDKGRRELTILKYLETIHTHEWNNFMERIDVTSMDQALASYPTEVRLWASTRGQTLARTVQGMMMYEDAIKMLRWLEVGSDQTLSHAEKVRRMDDLVRLKFSYVTSCQIYGQQQRSNAPQAADIDFLMTKYKNWRVSYVDERMDGHGTTRYDAVLIKSLNDEIVEVYRYELPGQPILGEGKPENQNIALQFTRGEFVQTIDMNQEHYFEETLKMPHFLQTAVNTQRQVAIIGMKEHIFTARASSLARFMTVQELVFVSLTQRVLADPLEARMHYGHPDVFDKFFIMSNGGVSKASKGINLSEDVFGGFNVTLRGGSITHQEFMLCGKGRDVAMSQINAFEAKLANGSAESSLSREAHRMGHHLDFFRLNSVYYGHMGFYIANFLTVVCVFVYAYSKVYVSLHSETEFALISATNNLTQLATVLNTQFIFQFGMLMTIPLFATLLTENSIRVGISKFIEIIVTLGPVFYVFETGTKAHYFDVAILRGGSKYRGTGRGFVITREMFVTFFKEYAASHYRKAVELVALMVIYGIYGNFSVGTNALDDWCSNADCENGNIPLNVTLLAAYSSQGQSYGVASFAVWLLGVSWLLAPFFFNTDGLVFSKTKVDVREWLVWMSRTPPQNGAHALDGNNDDSWVSWWQLEMNSRAPLKASGRIALFLREFRHFFIMIYIFLVDFDPSDAILLAAGIGGVIVVLFNIQLFGVCGKRFLPPFVRSIFYIGTIVIIVASVGVVFYFLDSSKGVQGTVSITIGVFAGLYGILQYLLALNGIFNVIEWKLVQNLAFLFDMTFGMVIVIPFFLLSAAPFMSIIQTRMMYNDGFSKALSTAGEFAASISVLIGLLGGFSFGWLTCVVFSLGFVNDPADGFQNTSFKFFLDQEVPNYDREILNLYLGIASAVAVGICGLVLHCFGRRRALIASCLTVIGGVVTLFIDPAGAVTIGCCLVAGGIAALALGSIMYGFEITTVEWKGKSVLLFLLGSALGFLIEASILHTNNDKTLALNWTNNPTYDWRYQILYGALPLPLLLIAYFWIPESPVWLHQRSPKDAETVLIRLRQKHDVAEELEELRFDFSRTGSFQSSQLPRLVFMTILQGTYAISSSNALLFRYLINKGEGTLGGAASRWQEYYGLMTLFGLLVGIFTIDQIRRKTILKDILPFVALTSCICGVLELISSVDIIWIEAFLFLLFFAVALSLGSVTWLSAMEVFTSRYQRLYTPISFMVFYIVQTIVFAIRPPFAESHFIFAGATIVLTAILFFFCASTKDGAIRLKSEKKQEKETEQSLHLHSFRSSRSRSHLRALSNRPSRSNNSRLSAIDTTAAIPAPLTPQADEPSRHYDEMITPQSRSVNAI